MSQDELCVNDSTEMCRRDLEEPVKVKPSYEVFMEGAAEFGWEGGLGENSGTEIKSNSSVWCIIHETVRLARFFTPVAWWEGKTSHEPVQAQQGSRKKKLFYVF